MLNEDTITVFTHFIEPELGRAVGAEVTSPYHLVKVRKNDLEGGFTFALSVESDILVSKNTLLALYKHSCYKAP